jgi:hypothetical protein
MAVLPTIRPDGDILTGGWASTGATFWETVDDDPDSANDADFVSAPDATSSSITFDLPAMPADFASMLTLSVTWRGRMVAYVNDTYTITARALNVALGGLTADMAATRPGSSFANETIAFTSVTASDKATWDGARLRFTVTWAGSMGTDTGVHLDISAFELNGTYTASGPAATSLLPPPFFQASSLYKR